MSDFLSGFRRSLTMLGLSTPPTPEVLEVGMPAPGFTLPDENRVPHHLSDYYGQWLVLYFYPKDNTPGCVMEACAFRDEIAPFHERNAKVVGISIDNADNHQKFINKYGLPFTLLSDPEGRVAERYGAHSGLLGISYAKRQTFLIDPESIIRHIWRTVPTKGHAQDVIAVLDSFR